MRPRCMRKDVLEKKAVLVNLGIEKAKKLRGRDDIVRKQRIHVVNRVVV
jgi:hypothetical protein